MPPIPSKLRKAYVNRDKALILLRFEDGHEIKVRKGTVKTFDAYAGETIKVVEVLDERGGDRELLEAVRAEDLPDADGHEAR